MHPPRRCVLSLVSLFSLAALAAAALVTACDTEDATMTVVDNAYPGPADGGDLTQQTVVYRAWWVATYFPDPVAGGATSSQLRTIPAEDFAYAVLATGWDPASTSPPTRLVVAKSKTKLAVDRGALLHIAVSDQTFDGNCAANQPLSQVDADFITKSIFPGEFASASYDAKTCTTTLVTDGGADAGVDAEAGADAEAGRD